MSESGLPISAQYASITDDTSNRGLPTAPVSVEFTWKLRLYKDLMLERQRLTIVLDGLTERLFLGRLILYNMPIPIKQ